METDDLIDLEAYASHYTGLGKITRLQFIAKQTAGSQLELDALKMAADELKKGVNVVQYEEVMGQIRGRLGAGYAADEQWISRVRSKAGTDLARMEFALTSSKTGLRKEAIRLNHIELARHHLATGNIQEAFKSYIRTRDYCTTPADMRSMCLHVIGTALAMHSWANVHQYASRAEGMPDIASHPEEHSKVRAAEGVALLHDGKYKAAARRFTEVSPEMGTSFSEALSPQDVATMGALCALASFSRAELKRQVVDNLGFREYVEAMPEVRDMVQDFYAAQYTHALERLARITPQLRLDLYLSSHVGALTKALRSKALVQYTQSFVAVRLQAMATVFSCTSEELETELAWLITQGQVAGRLDGHAKVLHARRPNQRASSFKAALAAGDEYLFNAQAALLRASLTKHDLIQRPAAMKKGLGFRDL